MSERRGWREQLRLMAWGYPRGGKVLPRLERTGTPLLVLAVFVLGTFAAINEFFGHRALAAVEIVVAGLLGVVLALRWRLGFDAGVRIAIMLAGFVVFLVLFADGGIGTTGAWWSLIYPFLAFVLMGVRGGWPWVAALVLGEGALFVADLEGWFRLPYEREAMMIFPAMLGFFTLVANILAVQQECQQGELAEAHDRLEAERQLLDRRVNERTRTLRKVNARLQAEIEERKQAMETLAESEKKLRQAQKMEAVGTLVGGIAHDFNNMLTGVMAHLYMLEGRVEHDSEALERVRKMRKLLDRAADMIRQLMTFARKDSVEFKGFDFVPFIKEAWKLSKVSIPERIHLSCDFPSDPLYIMGDATQLQQVLMNLMNNARDALVETEQPELKVSVSLVSADRNLRIHHPEAKAERYLCLSVSDNGPGIPPEMQEKIFEPFFTTKAPGKGTGLGLAMVFGAVQTHGGFIEVESEPGRGTTFRLYFPALDEQSHLATSAQSDSFQPGQGETLLLVDDDSSLLEANRDVLTSLGYRVLIAQNGMEAVEVFRRHAGDIDMVVTDVVMPRLGGPSAVERMRKVREVPVLYVTGYDKDGSLAGDVPVDRDLVLEKPFSMGQLSRRIRRMLDSHRTEVIPPAT